MLANNFSYNDLLKSIANISGSKDYNSVFDHDYDSEDINNLICLDNSFFHIIKFPEFYSSFISSNVSQILGYNPQELTLEKLYNLIHPDDYTLSLMATQKMYKFFVNNYSDIIPMHCVMSLNFRIKTKRGDYIRMLSNNCLYKKGYNSSNFKTLSYNTDITHSDSLSNKRIGYKKYESINSAIAENNNKNIEFSSREKELLGLLASGKSSFEIGKILNISKHTVDTHRRRMLAKANFGNTTELIVFAILNELI